MLLLVLRGIARAVPSPFAYVKSIVISELVTSWGTNCSAGVSGDERLRPKSGLWRAGYGLPTSGYGLQATGYRRSSTRGLLALPELLSCGLAPRAERRHLGGRQGGLSMEEGVRPERHGPGFHLPA